MKRKVGDVMTHDVVTADESTPFKQIVWLMESNGVSALPVVDLDGQVVGIVSEADLLLKEENKPDGGPARARKRRWPDWNERAEGTVAHELMTSPVVITKVDAPIPEAARVMHRYGVKRLPVVDTSGKLVGVISRKDVLKVFLRSDDDIHTEIVDDVMDRKLWLTRDEAEVRVDVSDGVVHLEGWLERKSLIDILVGLVLGVEGVVSVDNRLTYTFDDTHVRPDTSLPWGILPHALRGP